MYLIIGGDGKEYGPKPKAEIQSWIREGRANALSQVKAQGEYEWKALGGLPEFASDFGGSSAVPAQPPVVAEAAQPPAQYPGTPYSGAPVPNYLVQSILVTLCCCLPFGIAAIVYAAKVDGLASGGRIAEAQEASRKAKMWCWIGFGVGIPGTILAVAIQMAAEGM